jgi:hypothetical protein
MAGATDNKTRARTRIPRPAHPTLNQSQVKFSFQYLDLESEKFGFDRCGIEFLKCFLCEMKRLGRHTVAEFCEWDNDRHSHAIEFSETTEPGGFPGLDDQLEPEEFWQFGLVRTRPWRVHGFFIDSVFYVVWLDPEHRLSGTKTDPASG